MFGDVFRATRSSLRARRFDRGAGTAAADLRYYYDASDQRVLKRATVGTEDRYTVYLFDTPYLLANGVRLAR